MRVLEDFNCKLLDNLTLILNIESFIIKARVFIEIARVFTEITCVFIGNLYISISKLSTSQFFSLISLFFFFSKNHSKLSIYVDLKTFEI